MARRTATINKKPERAVIIGAGITEKYYFSHFLKLADKEYLYVLWIFIVRTRTCER